MHSVSHAHCLAVVRCHFVAVLPSRAAFRFGLRLSLAGSPMHRGHRFLNYGLVVRFRLLPTPPLDDAGAFSYGQPVLCPTGTSTPLFVRSLRRTMVRSRRGPSTSVTLTSDLTIKTGGLGDAALPVSDRVGGLTRCQSM